MSGERHNCNKCTHRIYQTYLDGDLDELDVNTLDKRFDERVRASVDEYLGTHPLQNKVTAKSYEDCICVGATKLLLIPH
jgi:hypothetical protein